MNSPDALFTTSVTLLSTPTLFSPPLTKSSKGEDHLIFSDNSFPISNLQAYIFEIFSSGWFVSDLILFRSLLYVCYHICLNMFFLKKRKERGKNHSVSNNEHVHLFASGLHTQFSQKARADHDLAFDISCLQARGD